MTESDATSISYPTRRRSRACNGRSWQATSTRRIGLCHIPGTLRPRSRSIPFSRGLPLFCFCTGWDYCAGRAVVSKSRARCCGSVKSRKSRESLRPQDWVPNAQKSDTDHRRLCEQRLDLSRQNFAARLDQRDFRDQFFDEHIAKRIEVSCDQDKSTGPTDHVLSIVVFKPPWRIRVFRSPQGVGENNQAVDRNSSPDCLVSRRAHITAAIVIAVSRHIDCTPLQTRQSRLAIEIPAPF